MWWGTKLVKSGKLQIVTEKECFSVSKQILKVYGWNFGGALKPYSPPPSRTCVGRVKGWWCDATKELSLSKTGSGRRSWCCLGGAGQWKGKMARPPFMQCLGDQCLEHWTFMYKYLRIFLLLKKHKYENDTLFFFYPLHPSSERKTNKIFQSPYCIKTYTLHIVVPTYLTSFCIFASRFYFAPTFYVNASTGGDPVLFFGQIVYICILRCGGRSVWIFFTN